MRNVSIVIRRAWLVALPMVVSMLGCGAQMIDSSGLPGGSGGAGGTSDTIGAAGTGGSIVTGGGAGGASSGASGGTGLGVSGTGGSGTSNGSGAGAGTGSPGGSGVSVSASGLPCDVQTFLGNRCQTCHGAVPAGGAPSTLVTYQDLTAPSRSDPTQTEAAMAVSRMLNTTLPMPPRPGTPATAADVAVLQTWIAAGYPMGSCGGGGGTADGGVADGGGTPGDPFAAAPVCTSKTLWTQGTRGSASMQPGVACINCHSSGEGPRFALAGTVYPTAHEPDQCDGASGVTGVAIVITGADGKTVTLTPNAAGNFSSSAAVTTPYQAKVTYMGRERLMVAAQTSGDCNSCHTQSGANAAPGRILLP